MKKAEVLTDIFVTSGQFKMKVLIISSEFPPEIGGAGTYSHDIAIGLSKNNVKTDIMTYKNGVTFNKVSENLASRYNAQVYAIKPLKFLHFIQFIIALRKVLSQNSYDYIILSDARAKKFFALFKCFFEPYYSKSVSVMHGNEINSFFKTPSRILNVFNIDRRLRAMFEKQKKIITVSESEERIWKDFLPHLSDKIVMVKHGVNEDQFKLKDESFKSSFRNRLGIDSQSKIILSASRIVKEKGQDNLLHAFASVTKRINDVHLLIVGDGAYLSDLKFLAKKLEIESNIRFIGSVDREELPSYYAVADLFVLPSRYIEAFGLVYIEAAGCGTTSIGGNLGGVKDVIDDNFTGRIIDPFSIKDLEEKLTLLLQNDEQRNELALNASQKFVREYTSQKAAYNLLKKIDL